MCVWVYVLLKEEGIPQSGQVSYEYGETELRQRQEVGGVQGVCSHASRSQSLLAPCPPQWHATPSPLAPVSGDWQMADQLHTRNRGEDMSHGLVLL